jgi:hypothetical protein
MTDSDKARPEVDGAVAETTASARDAGHTTSFTAESAPQASIEAPEPFTELENLYA